MIRAFDKWLLPYLFRRRWVRPEGKVRVFLLICDHFEPFHHTDKAGALARMGRWKSGYVALQKEVGDVTGLKPVHNFFYPIEQYDEEVIHRLAEICGLCDGEAEFHLHHKDETAEHLKVVLEGKERFVKHGLLSRSPEGEVSYGFIHGNWALDDSDPHGKNCGVANELGVLRESGCYADFTMPSAPHGAQTRTINSIYYAKDTPARKSHDFGIPASAATKGLRTERDQLLLMQGPLALNWQQRKWGLVPKVENADLTGHNPPTAERFRLWLQLGVHVEGRPDWVFVKLHTHGAVEANSNALLGEPMRRFCKSLRQMQDKDANLDVHFITARQAVNLVHAAEDGCSENWTRSVDYRYNLIR